MANALTVYAYGNVDALHGIFNAIAMVMNSNDFKDMVKVGVLIGFATVATLAMLPGYLSKSWNWFLSVAVLSSVLLVPKSTLTIVDKLGQQAPVVVANVPWSLALMASVKSSIGAALTDLFETAFQTIPSANVALPSELSYLEHGVMFGSRLVRDSRDAQPLSLYAQGDLVQYIRNCIFPEQGQAASADAMENSTDLVTTYANMNNPAFSSSYHDAGNGYVLTTATCDVVWTKILPGLNAAGAEAVRRAAKQSLPDLYKTNSAAAIAKIDASLPAVYAKASLASAAATASEIMLQNIMINATAEASALYGASLNDPSTLMFSMMNTQAVQQMNAGNMVQGRLAEEALPIIRNITEGILYAVFPVLCILLVASEGKALMALFKSYAFVLIWVELWPPMFAIVNYLQTLEAAKALNGAGYLSGGGAGLTLGTATPIFSASVSTLATTSWMVTFVPVIAASLLFGFDKIMAITGASGGGLRAAQSEAAAATKGNLSAGSVSFDQQQLAAYRSDPMMYRTESVGGVEYRNVVTGQILGQYREASAPVSINDTVAMTRGLASEAAVATQQASRSGRLAEQALNTAFNTARGAAQSNSKAASRSLGWDVSAVGSDGIGKSDVDEVARRIAESNRIGDASAVSRALTLSLSGAPLGPLLKALGGGATTQSTEQLARDLVSGVDNLRKIGTQRKQELVNQFRHGEAFEDVRRGNQEATRRVESSFQESQAHRRTEQESLDRSRQLSAKVEGAERFMRQSSANFANLLDQFARARYGVSVHDGVADPRRWQKIVHDFVAQGTIRTDTADGKLMWIPPDPGLGPQAVAPTLIPQVRDVQEGGEAGLQTRYAEARLSGGEEAVRTAADRNDKSAKDEQKKLGLNPDSTVTDGGLVERVADGQRRAAQAAAEAEKEAKEAQGKSQVHYDERKQGTSEYHRPIVTNDRNKALDATASAPSAFPDEAAKDRERTANWLQEIGKVEIPTTPPSPGEIPSEPPPPQVRDGGRP